MTYFSPNDNPISGGKNDTTDANFGGNREYTEGERYKSQDYKSPVGGASNVKKNPVDETSRDIDEMTEIESGKREFTRRAETWDRRDHNKEHFHKSDKENQPLEDPTPVLIPDDKKHGPKLKYELGQDRYEGEVR